MGDGHAQTVAPDDTASRLACALYGCCLFLGSGCINDPVHDFVRRTLRSPSTDKPADLLRYAQKRARADALALERCLERVVPCH
jgi:hypothetical protein